MISDILNFLYIVIYVAPFAFLRYYPFKEQLRLSIKTLILIYTILIMVQAFLFCYIAGLPSWTFAKTQKYQLFFSIFNSLLSLLLIREKLFKQLFVWGIVFSLAGFMMTNANFLEYLLFANISMSLPYYFFTNIFSVLQIILIFPFVFKYMKQHLRPTLQIASEQTWTAVWIIFILLYSGSFLATRGLSFMRSDNFTQYLIRIFCFGSIIGSSLIFSIALKQTAQNISIIEKARAKDRQLILEREHFQSLLHHIDEVKAARHDLRHHMTLIQSFLKEHNYTKLKSYIDTYAHTLPMDSPLTYCTNYAIDTIVRYYAEEAKQNKIITDILLHLPKSIKVSESDLCIVFGNLLENALEACKRQNIGEKFITLSAALTGGYLIITIDNSYDGVILKRQNTFFSSKRFDKGIGISSIKAVAEKYLGETEFNYSDQIFHSSIMLRDMTGSELIDSI